jgi:hypothetical protein
MKSILLLFVCAGLALTQDGPNSNPTQGPPMVGYELVLNFTGTNVTSICYARAFASTGLRASTYVAISAVSKANPAVVTSTGHGFALSARPQVTISGATGTGWTAINGTFVATVIDANTFSIPVDSTGFGTLAGTVVFKTTAPRATMPEWAVKKYAYDGSNNNIFQGWLTGSSALSSKCSDASSTTVVLQ